MNTESLESYTFADRDEFNRKPIAENLIKLLKSDIEISPILIDGDWGTGKSEFCHKTIKLIKDEHKELEPLYINAFKADSVNNPLLTLIAEIAKKLSDKSYHLRKSAIPVIKSISANIGHDLISNKLGVNTRGIVKRTKDSLERTQRKQLEILLEDQIQAEDRITKLKDALKTLAQEKKIILFIDELDRCRPDYAISMLETAKHIFDVEGISFVLIANTKQITASINHAYGDIIEAFRYLEKFIKFRFQIEKESLPSIRCTNDSYTYYLKLIEESDLLKETWLKVDNLREFLISLIKANNITLRGIEQFVRNIEIYESLTSDSYSFRNHPHSLVIFGIFLHTFYPEASKRLRNSNWDLISEFEKILNLKLPIESEDNEFLLNEIILFIVAKKQNLLDQEICINNEKLDYLKREYTPKSRINKSNPSEIIHALNTLALRY